MIGNIIDKLKIREIALVLFISGIIILFAPEKFLGILGLQVLRDEYRSHIGLIVLVCFILCMIWLATWFFSQVLNGDMAAKKVSRTYLKKLISTDEKGFLIENFYNHETKEFNSSGKVDLTSGYIAPLVQAMIIYQSTRLGHETNHWSFNLQPDVRIYLNKAIRKKKIVVNKNGKYEWKL